MNLENSVKDVIANKLGDGTIEKLIEEQLEKGVTKALESLFGSYGDVTKVIEAKVKSVMVPYLENYDYSQYIVKLDSVLTEIINKTTTDNRNLLDNFKELMSVDASMKEIKISDLFNKWCEYVAENVETDDLKVDCDDGPHYESVEVNYSFEENETRKWLNDEKGRIIFECEHDEKMNICIDVYRWKNIHKEGKWDFRFNEDSDLNSLRHIDKFSLYLMSLKQSGVEIEIDTEYENDYITPNKEPEAYFE